MHPDDPAPDLYLAPSSRPLLFSYAAALLQDHPAEIVYMNDYAPLPAEVEARLRQAFPHIALTVRNDRSCAEEFATLPRWLPAILRRNLAPRRGRWLARPADAPPAWLGPRYRTAVIYVTGPFLTKTLRHRCARIVLREDGLGNYHPRRVGWGKALLRAFCGLPPFRHFMGEEPWVDAIELARPEALPKHLGKKAHRLDLNNHLHLLPTGSVQRLVRSFWDDPTLTTSGPSALVLEQPLAKLGLTSQETGANVYASIENRLRLAGYEVYRKKHPQDQNCANGDRSTIPPFFPMEAWPWTDSSRFEIAVALCSASLDNTVAPFSNVHFQLVSPEAFARGDLSGWEKALDDQLAELSLLPTRKAE